LPGASLQFAVLLVAGTAHIVNGETAVPPAQVKDCLGACETTAPQSKGHILFQGVYSVLKTPAIIMAQTLDAELNLATTSTEEPTVKPIAQMSQDELHEYQSRHDQPSKDCELSDWTDWGACVEVSGDGLRSWFRERNRQVLNQQLPGGHPCDIAIQREMCKDIGYQPYTANTSSIWHF